MFNGNLFISKISRIAINRGEGLIFLLAAGRPMPRRNFATANESIYKFRDKEKRQKMMPLPAWIVF